MISQYDIILPSFPRGIHLITKQLTGKIDKFPNQGIFHAFLNHTSAGLCINENADPTVRKDMEMVLDKLVPEDDPQYKHTLEGSDDMPAHVKTVLSGCDITIPITDGKLNLGTWQGIYLCEYRNNGGARKITISIYS